MSKVVFNSNLGKVQKGKEQQARRALEIIGGMAESYAKMKCHVDTGNLRNSITHKVDSEGKSVSVGTNVKYAPYVELGHHQQPGRYVPKIKKRLKASYVKPYPYLRPAVEDHINQYKNVLQNELSK